MALEEFGLIRLGHCPVTADDEVAAGSIEVIANAGSTMFEIFKKSFEAVDGKPDPLNRWTRRVIDAYAASKGVPVVYPFDGPPYYPFQRWAQRADPALHQSPIGLLVHEHYGLWLALRAAILLPEGMASAATQRASPCASCVDKPCLNTCPVRAFDGERYDVTACVEHIATIDLKRCAAAGCAARHACPVGQEFAYSPAHAQFHMAAFERSNSIKSE